jgi:hypothetical protein
MLRGEGKIERARGGQDTLRDIASSFCLYFGWLATKVCVCSGQRSSEISCDKCSLRLNQLEDIKLYFNTINTAEKLYTYFSVALDRVVLTSI